MIRHAEQKDLLFVLAIEASCFSTKDQFDDNQFIFGITNKNILLYEIDNKVIGYIFYLKISYTCKIYSIAVFPDQQNNGIAQQLLSYVHDLHKNNVTTYKLEVCTKNQKAINLYKKNGYNIKGILHNYYDINADAYIMEKCNKWTMLGL